MAVIEGRDSDAGSEMFAQLSAQDDETPDDPTQESAEPAPQSEPDSVSDVQPGQPEPPDELPPGRDEGDEEGRQALAPEVPFAYRVSTGINDPKNPLARTREITIPGSVVGSDGVFIPTEQMKLVTQRLQEGERWVRYGREEYAQLRHQLSTVTQDIERREALVKAYMDQFAQLMSSPEALLQHAQNLEVYGPALRARAEKAMMEAELTQLRNQGVEREADSFRQQAPDLWESSLADAVTEYFPGVFDDNMLAAIQSELGNRIYDFLDYAKQDLPNVQYADGSTVRKGDIVFNGNALYQELANRAAPILMGRASGNAAAVRVEKAVTRNGARLQPSTTPPTVATRGAGGTSRGNGPPRPSVGQDGSAYRAWLAKKYAAGDDS